MSGKDAVGIVVVHCSNDCQHCLMGANVFLPRCQKYAQRDKPKKNRIDQNRKATLAETELLKNSARTIKYANLRKKGRSREVELKIGSNFGFGRSIKGRSNAYP